MRRAKGIGDKAPASLAALDGQGAHYPALAPALTGIAADALAAQDASLALQPSTDMVAVAGVGVRTALAMVYEDRRLCSEILPLA